MKKLFEKIKEIKKMPRGNAILFFGFYFVFFLIVFLLLNTGSGKPITSNDYKINKAYSFNTNYLQENNYSFDYTISLDDIKYKYSGKRNGDVSSFNFNERKYYSNKDNYLVYQDTWIKSDNPFVVDEMFVNANEIIKLIELAAYESKTEYDSGKKIYNFLISTNTINQYIYNINSDFFEEPNRIIISTDENNSVSSITLNLDSFCTLNKQCQKNLRVELLFDNFGNIEEIESPII